jgi:hypothetical protein
MTKSSHDAIAGTKRPEAGIFFEVVVENSLIIAGLASPIQTSNLGS